MALDTLLTISCICIVIAITFYFFHWNRFLAFLIGWGIRLLYWNNESSSIWVEIGSVHFSILAGRILLKDVTYHSSNQTIKVVKGQLQWRYWIRRPTSEEEIGTILGGEDHEPTTPSMHCRIQISFQGFEWFLYNRTAAYDDIISKMEANSASRPVSRSTERRPALRRVARTATSSSLHPSAARGAFLIPVTIQKAVAWARRQLPNLDPKDLLPLGIEVIKGAIICGNSSTPNLLVAEFQRTEGTFGIVKSRSKLDLHKQILALKFQNALIRYVRNEDYVDPMTTMGELVHGRVIQYSTLGRASSYLSYRSFIKLWRRLGLSALTSRYSSDRRKFRALQRRQSTSRTHKKPSKAAEDATPVGADFSTLEYVTEPRILEAPMLELSYYADAVGEVPEHTEHISAEPVDIGNGDLSPEWGVDIIINGGFLRYGPWADRQRIELQRTFFPPAYYDGEVTPLLHPGDKRMWTALRVFIELRGGTTLQLPFREASKDWQWDGKAEIPHRQRVREPATIHLSVGDRSSINYTMPMVMGPSGYQPVLDIHLDTLVVTSSLNDIRLVTAESCRVRCELPTPLKWNLERRWIITMSLRQPILYLIRDHINMFIDLGKDWAAGPPSDYQRFIPMVYALEFEMHHYELNLYANDHNIIDKPLIRDENALLTARGAHVISTVEVPLNAFRQESTRISFTMRGPDPAISLSLPRWNTNALHAPKLGNSLAKIGLFCIDGSYQYFTEVRKEHVEQLKLNFMVRDIVFKLLGWSIRYFMVIRDNYFGSFTHFSTLYEYLEKRRCKLPPGDPVALKYREGKSNMLQVDLMLCIERGTLILPAGLPGYRASGDTNDLNVGIGACVAVTVPGMQLQLRLHDYFMGKSKMSLNFDTISGGILDDYPEKVTYSRYPLSKMAETLVIDGLDITANRLFGPQPRTATYVCIWEIRLGAVKLLLSAFGGRVLVAAGNAFRLNYADLPNAPATEYLPAVDPDITFVKFHVATLDVIWRAGHAALVISLQRGVKVDINDLGGRYHRKVTSLRVPEAVIKVLLAVSSESNRWLEAAEIIADAFLDIYASPRGHRDMTRAQAAFVEEQDRLTNRARRMFVSPRSHGPRHRSGVYLPQPLLPRLPEPIQKPPLQQYVDERPTTSRPMPSIAQLSGSDTEEGFSEADRDARLAKTRSSTPIASLFEEDNQNMTSGDESDDEDLTDASSESDWFEFATNRGMNHSLLMRFSRITRHYTANYLETPELWNRHPFLLTKDRISLGISQADRPTNECRNEATSLLDEGLGLDDDRDLISYRFKSHNGVNVNITPLVLPAAVQFEADMERNPLGPELCIDSLMTKYFSNLTTTKSAESCTLFEVSIPSVAVHILQVIDMVDGHPAVESAGPADLDVISVVHGGFDGLIMSGLLTGRKVTVKTNFDRFSLTLDISDENQTLRAASSNEFVFGYILQEFQAELLKEGLGVIWGGSVIQLGLLGPEYMTATCIALARHAKQLGVVNQRWSRYSSGSTRTIVRDILHSSADSSVLDPLSTIQPSYLVQTGTPQNLRTDIAFRFLFHLRNCLRGSGVELSEILLDGADFDLISLLETRLEALDQEAYPDIDLSFLESFLPGLQTRKATSPRASSSPVNSISIRFARLAIIVLDPRSQPSQVAVTDVQLTVRMRTLDVSQLPGTQPPSSLSQILLEDGHNQSLIKTSATMLFGDVTLAVFPHLMQFAQNILWVRRHYHGVETAVNQPPNSINLDAAGDSGRLLSLDVTWYSRRLRIQAAAENLVFEFGVSDMRGASSVLLHTEGQQHRCMNHSTVFGQIYIRAHSPVDMTKKSDQDILASLELTNGRVNAISRQDRFSNVNLRLIFAIGGLQFSVPRSALRLFRFVEEWRADYLPGIEATAQALLAEVRRAPTKPVPRTASHPFTSQPVVQVQGRLSYLGISLQVMHGTWLSWGANCTTAYFNSSEVSASNSVYAFGLQVSAMDLIVSSNPNVRDLKPNTRIKLALPSLSITGHLDGRYIYALALIDFVELKVKPSHWDTLLAVQQKFGQDFNDLVTLVQKTHSRRTITSEKKSPPKPYIALKYNVFLKIHGFRVGLEGRKSTVYLECLDIGGGVNNTAGLAWNVDLSDLAFSLAPRTAVGRFSRKQCSAFVNVDFRISAGSETSEVSAGKVVQVSVTKIHAVMQPSSIGEVGDFIDHLQAEMLVRKEQRALELEAFKEKTQSILKTFEIGGRDSKVQEKSTWLDDYIINVSTRNIGVAFPLTHDQDLELPHTGSGDSTAIRAFLFSIKAVEFGTHRGETGQATIRSLSFQFVSRFRQSVASDFSGENHSTQNRLLYPEMKAQLRSTRSRSFRNIWVKATVSGFILDLDSSIPSFVFSLIDVYHQGKDRMEKFSATVPRTPSTLESSTEKDSIIEHGYTALPTLNVLASLIFLSGKVRVYSGSASNLHRKKSFSNTQHEPSDEQVMDIGAEVFNLPGVSVWTEYRSAPAPQTTSIREAEPSILMFKSTVHSSQNTLRPTLLPFLTELVSHVETRLRKASLRTSRPIPVDMSHLSAISPATAHESFESVSTMRISFSLRIDQSKLELTCQPDVNVLAGLHWDSGGFVVNISPGARDVNFTGSVGGLTLGLKHGFLSEDCVKLDARNLAFSVSFSKTSVSSVSLVLDTEFLGVVRFSRLQDILCFKAVWLDRIPIFHSQPDLPSSEVSIPMSPSPQPRPPKPSFSTIALVRIRQIKLDIDLGQSISAVTLDLTEAIMRTKLTEIRSEVSIFVRKFATAARGNIAGHAHVANCVFETIRNTESNALSTDGRNRMLELRMTSGPLTVALESDHQKLLHYRAEPLEIKVFDDWALVSPGERTEDKPLRLSFTVTSPEIIAVVTVGTIPKLMSYGNKFTANLDAQRQGASRESKAFRVTRTPKPDNPLSAVAEAMLHSARSRFKEMESGLSYVITQHMSLHLDALRLVVFPRTMDDLEIAQFVAREVRARLDRLVQSDAMPGKRDLNLSFSSMTISKYSGLGHPPSVDLMDVREWLTSLLKNAPEAIIVGLPSMTMHMISEEIVEELATNLVYDFHSVFVRREGMRHFEDIYITLNVALYSWLTLLRKNLTREMDQVKATTDWRALLNPTPSSGAVGKKKVPSALNLLDIQNSPTMPDPANRQFSPFSPTTALKSSSVSDAASPLSAPLPSPEERTTLGPQPFPSIGTVTNQPRRPGVVYQPRSRHIERLTMRQLGEATPDVMHPFFMKKAGFNLEDSLPQYVNEYATTPLEEVMEILLKLYSRQLLAGTRS